MLYPNDISNDITFIFRSRYMKGYDAETPSNNLSLSIMCNGTSRKQHNQLHCSTTNATYGNSYTADSFNHGDPQTKNSDTWLENECGTKLLPKIKSFTKKKTTKELHHSSECTSFSSNSIFPRIQVETIHNENLGSMSQYVQWTNI